MEEEELPVKNIVIVGDGAVGKSSLLFAYINYTLLRTYETTIFDKKEITLTVDNKQYLIRIHDTAGHEEFEKMRQIFYKTANCFVLCYSIAERSSFENVKFKWCKELRRMRRSVPIVLVATKVDLRPSLADAVTKEEGIELCQVINAKVFLECSASTQSNVREVIYEAVRAAVNEEETAERKSSVFKKSRRWCLFNCC